LNETFFLNRKTQKSKNQIKKVKRIGPRVWLLFLVFPFFEKKKKNVKFKKRKKGNQSNMGVARVGKLTNRLLLLVDYRLNYGQNNKKKKEL
jgi:hypothetical protein